MVLTHRGPQRKTVVCTWTQRDSPFKQNRLHRVNGEGRGNPSVFGHKG